MSPPNTDSTKKSSSKADTDTSTPETPRSQSSSSVRKNAWGASTASPRHPLQRARQPPTPTPSSSSSAAAAAAASPPTTKTTGASATKVRASNPTPKQQKNNDKSPSKSSPALSKKRKPTPTMTMSIGDLIPTTKKVVGQPKKKAQPNKPAAATSTATAAVTTTATARAPWQKSPPATTKSAKGPAEKKKRPEQPSPFSSKDFPSLAAQQQQAPRPSPPSKQTTTATNTTKKAPQPPPPASALKSTTPTKRDTTKPKPPSKQLPNKKKIGSAQKAAAAAAAAPIVSSAHESGMLLSKNNTALMMINRDALAGSSGGGASGKEHDHSLLLKLYQQGKLQPGRQRIRPRKKKFSALKKKVLQERLEQWRAKHHHGDNDDDNDDDNKKPNKSSTLVVDDKEAESESSSTVCIYGFVDDDDPELLQEDEEEYQEIVDNLNEMATKVGHVQQIFVPKEDDIIVNKDNGGDNKYPCFVEFGNAKDAAAAVACWNDLVVGGQKLQVSRLPALKKDVSSPISSEEEWRSWCLETEQQQQQQQQQLSSENQVSLPETTSEVVLENALTEDDLEDEDCLQESVNDIKVMAEKFGVVDNVRVEKDQPTPRLYIIYRGDALMAQQAAAELGKAVIGGSRISAQVIRPLQGVPAVETSAATAAAAASNSIILENVLTEDDMEDEECLEESLNDLRELAQRFGPVLDVRLHPEVSESAVRIDFDASTTTNSDVAKAAVKGFHGTTVGGLTVSASLLGSSGPTEVSAVENMTPLKIPEKEEPTPMFSGEKRIPERFAECKRVPKVPNSGAPRKYATLVDDERVKPLLTEMLGELMRLQKRAVEDKNAKARRRLVMGLREVARGIRSHKVKMVCMANNLDEYGAIDEKLQEILDLAHEEGVPVFFEFSKRTLGKAVGKSIKVAVVGIQNADGAHQPYKKLLTLAPK